MINFYDKLSKEDKSETKLDTLYTTKFYDRNNRRNR